MLRFLLESIDLEKLKRNTLLFLSAQIQSKVIAHNIKNRYNQGAQPQNPLAQRRLTSSKKDTWIENTISPITLYLLLGSLY